jgi:hypothetical protein
VPQEIRALIHVIAAEQLDIRSPEGQQVFFRERPWRCWSTAWARQAWLSIANKRNSGVNES